ncbi:hypothetical protein MIND_01280400 [Mycena indigotica]|uniref:EF-hand domain-containing protein n=1 Tax=Mycena indigotica TaxID=2126181 RepID=A0A8H6VRQ0_9AGAR|nr:uncharacterized protein MIND_01280400 [Mycena indigotica]KAF7291359.1 hypothetical protein MIND_01280400 [Mycena indigotica]
MYELPTIPGRTAAARKGENATQSSCGIRLVLIIANGRCFCQRERWATKECDGYLRSCGILHALDGMRELEGEGNTVYAALPPGYGVFQEWRLINHNKCGIRLGPTDGMDLGQVAFDPTARTGPCIRPPVFELAAARVLGRRQSAVCLCEAVGCNPDAPAPRATNVALTSSRRSPQFPLLPPPPRSMSVIFPGGRRGRTSGPHATDADTSFVDLDMPPPEKEKEKRHHSPFSYLRIRKRSSEKGDLKRQPSRETIGSPRRDTSLPPVPPLPTHTRNLSEPPSPSASRPFPFPQPYRAPPVRANSGSDSSLSSFPYPPTPPSNIHALPRVVSPASSREDLTHARLATANAILPSPGPALAAAAVLTAAQQSGSVFPSFSREALGSVDGLPAQIAAHSTGQARGLRGIMQTAAMDKAKVAATVGPMITNGMQNLTKAQTIVDELIASEAWSVVKESAAAVLEPAKDVVVILDSVVKYIPAIMVAESIFSVVIKHELERNENDKNILVVYHTMSVFWFTMCDLQAIFRADHDHIKDGLDNFFQAVAKTIEDFGNFRDVYYRHGHFTHTLRSSEYRKKLTGFTTAFATHKSDLHFLLSESSALEIHETLGSVGGMAAQLDLVTKQLATVTGMLSRQTPFEMKIGEAVRVGGERALEDSSFLNQLARDHFGAQEDLDPQIQTHLRVSLDEALSSNMPGFSLKVEAAQKEMADALERSKDAILHQLNSGAYQLIKDDDIRSVWQAMNWKISCKSRHFVDAVHSHFVQRFSDHERNSGDRHGEEWTLYVLSQVIYYPSIADAIDDDGSGYISVHEVNHFFKSRPKEWSAPQWLAYWAAGWKHNSLAYKERCQSIFSAIESAARKVHPDNRPGVKAYIKTSGISELYLVVNSVAPDMLARRAHHSPVQLDALRADMMKKESEAISTRMERIQYQLESPETVLAVLGTYRLEGFILCVLELILERHLAILEVANSLVVHEQELSSMTNSMKNLAAAFGMRYRTLTESWRQQRLDTDFLVQSFAGGIFREWHQVFADQQHDVHESSYSPTYQRPVSPRMPRTPQEILIYPLPPQPTSPGLLSPTSPPSGIAAPYPNSGGHPTRSLHPGRNPHRGSSYFYHFDFERRPSERPTSLIEPASISEVYRTKTSKKPKLEDRITTLEGELSEIKGMLAQLIQVSLSTARGG